jgi:hypothetical protein
MNKDQDVLVPPRPAPRQKQLENNLASAPSSTIRIHPRIAETDCDCIHSLIAGLTEPFVKSDERAAIRGRSEDRGDLGCNL